MPKPGYAASPTLNGTTGAPIFPNAQLLANTLALPTTTLIGSVGMHYNGSDLELTEGNRDGTLLASAVRNATTATSVQTNRNHVALTLGFSITAVPGVDTVQLVIQYIDPITGQAQTMFTGAALATTGQRNYQLGPGVAAAAADITGTVGYYLPRQWRASVVHSGAGNFTYSLSFNLHPGR